MTTPWQRFKQAAHLEEPDQVPVAFIVDSPWLPGYAGISSVDFFAMHNLWFEINRGLLDGYLIPPLGSVLRRFANTA